MPRRKSYAPTIEPQLPERGSLSDLNIEPPLLVDPNIGGSFTSPAPNPSPTPGRGYDPSTDAVETPSSNPVLGHNDWIREHWNQFNPQDSIDEALDPWMNSDSPSPPMDYEHPDDALFFSPSREISKTYDQVSINDPNAPTITGNASTPFRVTAPSQTSSGYTYGPNDFFPRSSYPSWMGAFVNQYPNFPAGPIRPSDVGQGQVLVGSETFNNNPDPFDVPSTAETNPNISDQQLIEQQRAQLGLSNARNSAGNYADNPATAPIHARQSTIQNLLGVGQTSGQHYYSSNGGVTWTPVTGAAPQEVRFAQNSGTGNFNADQATKQYLLQGSGGGGVSGEGFHPVPLELM